MCLTIEQLAIIVLVIITGVYVVLTYLELKESKKQRFQDKRSTRQILSESRKQRLQDAEFRTMLKEVKVEYWKRPGKIDVQFEGSLPIRNWKFIIRHSKGNDKECIGKKIAPHKLVHEWGKRLCVDITPLFNGNNDTHIFVREKFKLYVSVKFDSFLGHNWIYKFESIDLMMQTGFKLVNAETEKSGTFLFELVDVIPPWEQEQKD